nr:MAG TPA: hypothetical protein [Caudoviricetes sp.]
MIKFLHIFMKYCNKRIVNIAEIGNNVIEKEIL